MSDDVNVERRCRWCTLTIEEHPDAEHPFDAPRPDLPCLGLRPGFDIENRGPFRDAVSKLN